MGVVLAHPTHLLGRGSCQSPHHHPQRVFSACHQSEERCRRPRSPRPTTAGSQPRLWVLDTLCTMPGFPAHHPKTPQQIPCLAIMIHFSKMKSAPLGSSQSPVAFGGSLQPSQAPWLLTQPVLEPGALTLSPSLPAASALPCSICLSSGVTPTATKQRGTEPSSLSRRGTAAS